MPPQAPRGYPVMTPDRLRRIVSRCAKKREKKTALSFYDALLSANHDMSLVIRQQLAEVQSVQTCLRDSETQREVLSVELAKLRWVQYEIEAREARAIKREARMRMARR